jgi:hypothetical protein
VKRREVGRLSAEWHVRQSLFCQTSEFRSRAISEDPMPRYKCKSIAALDIALCGLPAKMKVEADAGTGVSAKTVGELRKVRTWSENLVITTPKERHPESAVKISKASVATRTTPKP